jgi:hypothetical protein
MFICIDVANGYMSRFIETCALIRSTYPNKILIAGNVCTSEGVLQLVINGKVDIVKVGIGSGSCCTTRKQTGIGMPQLSAVIECADTAHGVDAHIISDGGLQVIGDFSKAYAAGADFVMSGSMFAGHIESGGELIEEKNDDGLINMAMLGSIGIFVIMFLIGVFLLATGIALGYQTGLFLFILLLGLLIAQIFSLFYKSTMLVKSLAAIGIVIFSGYIIYDTNTILQRNYHGDFITASLDYYLDILNIFTKLTVLNDN